MHTGAKIDFRKYSLLSAILILAVYFLARSMAEFYVMLIIFFAACLNQWMLVKVVRGVTALAATGSPINKTKMILMIVGKVVLLMAALTFGVQIMQKRIIIPVLIYVLQIAILYLSFYKTGAETGSR